MLLITRKEKMLLIDLFSASYSELAGDGKQDAVGPGLDESVTYVDPMLL
jgi:hypothetical protein